MVSVAASTLLYHPIDELTLAVVGFAGVRLACSHVVGLARLGQAVAALTIAGLILRRALLQLGICILIG